MEQEKKTRDVDPTGSEALETDRRKFLGKSFGLVPLVITLGKGHGGGGNSIHGTIWASNGTDWKHRGRKWWRGKDWDEYPRFRTDGNQDGYEARPDWDWQSPREEWRKWRPSADDDRKPDWKWDRDERDIPEMRDFTFEKKKGEKE